MIGIIAKKYLSEKNFNKLRELKYRLYCLSRWWKFKKQMSKYKIKVNNQSYFFDINNLYLIKYIPILITLTNNQKKIDVNKMFYVFINNLKIKTDKFATEFNYAIKEYNAYTPLKKGQVILDIGAYHGLYSFYAYSKIGDTGKIYAFEPDPNNYKILLKNIKRNNLKNIIPIKKALFNKSGTQKFIVSSAGSSIYLNNHNLNGDSINNKDIITVPTISLTDFIRKYKIKNIDFIKMDCEGSEIEICEDYLKNIYPKIKTNFAIASYHYRFDYKSKTSDLIETLFKNKNQYNIITRNKSHLTTYITKKNKRK